jgi:hypothetical protein
MTAKTTFEIYKCSAQCSAQCIAVLLNVPVQWYIGHLECTDFGDPRSMPNVPDIPQIDNVPVMYRIILYQSIYLYWNRPALIIRAWHLGRDNQTTSNSHIFSQDTTLVHKPQQPPSLSRGRGNIYADICPQGWTLTNEYILNLRNTLWTKRVYLAWHKVSQT